MDSFNTKALHGEKLPKNIQSKVTPIYQTSVFAFNSLEEMEGYYNGESPYLYTRVGNPNADELANITARLEGAPEGVAASSGLGAITAAVLAVAKSGDHIVAAQDVYGGTFYTMKEELSRMGIGTSFVDFEDLSAVEAAIRPETVMLYTESITNPFLRVENIAEVSALAKKKELVLMVDNTFATPFLIKPYELGADLVVHSATKYIGGHSDVSAGVVVGKEEYIQAARSRVVNIGMNLSPFESWLACRGAKTLGLRMERQSANAEKVADWLRTHAKVEKVFYPKGVSEQGNGAIVTIDLAKDTDEFAFFRSLGWIGIVPSLAGVETSVSWPFGTSHRSLNAEEKAAVGVSEKTVRISIGIEEAEDIIGQFKKALSEA
ncbi:aminotransferase class I/II-fold pyridoxal phosphate-dependent enzyme [Domibacillus sp. DTU_2020_1001157_1_SI_ALB_TIR_016]|uniref:trans-sulfuration enzyme family protein n=1 Tax=Domibacillus sp. DTU_2020_1001157_1_SI_ALB_TIR_016 TaxID=3077789 RepID=UPI0028EC272A|nr:aminotransferase class I/II-fold pyridoxal phosphate-dependent enzyme [Domibacillus sp. DTU_2020_1001157_1_SI_ALB_TIR_016]WNS81341.1 aminotransferase class I/II-fold pyridoxal phosphate-dependent enzyme [Domibacillus sp. DTU_2020_1001157_1_SI_ALB_TIR_016]